MKRRKILTAMLVSAGLIIGTTSAAFAVISTPTAIATTKNYNSQVTAYNASLVSFNKASARFRLQIAERTSAYHVYKSATSVSLQTYTAFLKANSPATTAAQYAVLISAYNSANSAYNVATASFKAAVRVYQVAAGNYEAQYRSVLQGYKTTSYLRNQRMKSIYATFNNAVHKASASFIAAKSKATTIARKTAAMKTRNFAVTLAIAKRNAALRVLRVELVKPVRIAITGDNAINGFTAIRPVSAIRSTRLGVSTVTVNKSVTQTEPSGSTSTISVAAYQAQVAASKTPVIAFNNATTLFSNQATVYSAAVASNTNSYNTALQAYQVLLQTSSPATTPEQYAALMTAYNDAIAAYNAATAALNGQSTAFQGAIDSYNASYDKAIQEYSVIEAMREKLGSAIKVEFDTATRNANLAFDASMSNATSDAQKSATISARENAIVAAVAARKAALDALGDKLDKPSRGKTQANHKKMRAGFEFVRPIKPEKPGHFQKSRYSHKSDKSHEDGKSHNSKKH